jgi:hypothetical protein
MERNSEAEAAAADIGKLIGVIGDEVCILSKFS